MKFATLAALALVSTANAADAAADCGSLTVTAFKDAKCETQHDSSDDKPNPDTQSTGAMGKCTQSDKKDAYTTCAMTGDTVALVGYGKDDEKCATAAWTLAGKTGTCIKMTEGYYVKVEAGAYYMATAAAAGFAMLATQF